MSFWLCSSHQSDHRALWEPATGHTLTYGQLADLVQTWSSLFKSIEPAGKKKLCFLVADNRVEGIAAYLAMVASGLAAALINPDLHPSFFADLVDRYTPEIIVYPTKWKQAAAVPASYVQRRLGEQMSVGSRPVGDEPDIHPDLALLLTTSGSTGSPKFVRLTAGNLAANAESIAEYLGLTSAERPITSLPLFYSYGLSVVNSHLVAGATIVCTRASVMAKEFWDAFRQCECTSLAGVPSMYQMLRRLRFERMNLPSLRTLTQAGGGLDVETKKYILETCRPHGRRFFVMYGQTEATARIAYVPPDRLTDKLGSIGRAIPGGNIAMVDGEREITGEGEQGEIVYSGPNVMLGYATSRACLSRGDELQGVLHTGDLACRDEEGFLFLSGRLSRFIKVFGHRINLDEVEQIVHRQFEFPVVCVGQNDLLMVACQADGLAGLVPSQVASFLKSTLNLHPRAITVRTVGRIPLTATSKIDYEQIRQAFESPSDVPAGPEANA
jgi:acyl-CoA synthetase (AMP-forming)/AMP-acid ligase II